MSDTTSKPELSELAMASPLLMNLYEAGVFPAEEIERRALGAQRLKEAFSSTPFYALRAAKDPDFWNEFYCSRPNW